MTKTINLWFDNPDKKCRIPQTYSKVLLNFMLGIYPYSVFEKFNTKRLENLFIELITKSTNLGFFSEKRPIWWPESLEFVSIPILRETVGKDLFCWSLVLQQLLLSARDFYSEQLYLSRKTLDNLKLKRKIKIKFKVSPAIFRPIRDENRNPNVPNMTNVKVKLKKESIKTFPLMGFERTPFVRLVDVLKKEVKSPIYSQEYTSFIKRSCKVNVFNIFQPIITKSIDKADYMNHLGLNSTHPIKLEPTKKKRCVAYKRYSTSVPFSSTGGKLLIDSFKMRYRYRGSDVVRRGCSINNPLRHSDNTAKNVNDAQSFQSSNNTESYHLYKFGRRPLNYTYLPEKIILQYCRPMTVNVKRLSASDLQKYMKNCHIVLNKLSTKAVFTGIRKSLRVRSLVHEAT